MGQTQTLLRALAMFCAFGVAFLGSGFSALGAPQRSQKTRDSAPKALVPIPADIAKLGPLSVGHPHAGFLINAVEIPPSDDYRITVPSHAFGTQETVDFVRLCVGKVRRQFPKSPKVMLGSLSAERGGRLPPHKSHRTGRDADVYFFRKPGARWLKAATRQDIDLPRTWALLRCFVIQTDVDMILIERKVQVWIEAYALSVGEDSKWIRGLFHDKGRAKTSIVRHVPGHVAHMHVRFTSAKARRRGVAAYDRLVAANLLDLKHRAVTYRVKKGDSLSVIAWRHKLSVSVIQKMNALKSTLIRVGQPLTLKRAVDIRGARDAVRTRPRYLPPGEQPTRRKGPGKLPKRRSNRAHSGEQLPPGPPPRGSLSRNHPQVSHSRAIPKP